MSLSVRSVVSNYGTPPPSLWTLAQKIGMKKPVSVRDLMARLEPAQYSLSMPSFRINMMRSGSGGCKTSSDTDYVSMSVKIRDKPIFPPVTTCVGDQTGGVVNVNLSTPQFTVLATDAVYFQYSILNSRGKPSDVVAFLEKVGSQLLTAAEKADLKFINSHIPIPGVDLSSLSPEEQGALIGAQLGFAVGVAGGIILPGLGVVLGALAGWFANNAVGFVFPNCDGPVAAGLYVFNPAQLRAQAMKGPQTDKNFGIDSAVGCGKNSDYDVTWSLSVH